MLVMILCHETLNVNSSTYEAADNKSLIMQFLRASGEYDEVGCFGWRKKRSLPSIMRLAYACGPFNYKLRFFFLFSQTVSYFHFTKLMMDTTEARLWFFPLFYGGWSRRKFDVIRFVVVFCGCLSVAHCPIIYSWNLVVGTRRKITVSFGWENESWLGSSL